jgi:regulatory protein
MNLPSANKSCLAAMQCALRLLTNRDHTLFELRAKMQRRGFADELIQSVMAQCQRLNYLDDAAFAIRYLEQCKAKNHGPRRIRQAMQQKGFSSELIDSVLHSGYPTDSELALADIALSKRIKQFQREANPLKRARKAHSYLYARGFSASTIAAIVMKRFPLKSDL